MDSVDTVLIAKEKPEKPKTYKNQEIQVDTLDIIDIPEEIVVEKKEKTLEKIKETEKIKEEETKESSSNSNSFKIEDNKSIRPKHVCVWTAEWILKRLKEENGRENGMDIALLRTWVHDKRQIEATYQTIERLLSLSDEDAIAIL